jgi:hypothetical protein
MGKRLMYPIVPGISIEELLDRYPGSVRLLIEKGLPCLVCGEPSWGTLEELAREKGWDEQAISQLVEEMNRKFSREVG